MATIQSIVENSTLVIDNSIFSDTGDKVFIRGKFYSSKPIMGAIIGTPIYFLLYHLGIKLNYGPNLAYYLIVFSTIKVLWGISILIFFRILIIFGLEKRDAIKGSLALGFGSLFFPYSSTYNNNFLSSSLILIGFYFYLEAKNSFSPKKNLLLSGLFLSAAGSVDLPTSIFFVTIFLLILRNKRTRAHSWAFLIPATLTFVPTLITYFSISGNLLPVNFHREYYSYQGSPWINSDNDFVGLSVESNSWTFVIKYFVNILFWERGIFLYNPFLIASTYFIIKAAISPNNLFQEEARFIGLGSLILIIFYGFFTANYGGNSYGFRWLFPLVPINYTWIFPLFNNSRGKTIFKILFAISSIIAILGLINPWSNATISNHSIFANIIELLLVKNPFLQK